jgi:hypothetical protein
MFARWDGLDNEGPSEEARMCHQYYKQSSFSEELVACPDAKEPCTQKGDWCMHCSAVCKGVVKAIALPQHKFSKGVTQFFQQPNQTGFKYRPHESEWLDEDSLKKPLSELGKSLVSMLENQVPLKRVVPKVQSMRSLWNDAPQMEKTRFLRLPRTPGPTGKPVATFGQTPVPHMPGVRVWLANAIEILEATGMEIEKFPNKPNEPNTYQDSVIAVYMRFRIEGKLEDAGAGYWLSPSLKALFTSVYVGLSFGELTQKAVVDIGLVKGKRTVVQYPCCYQARVASPELVSWTCKKGNIYQDAERVVSFRVGDVGVGHREWVEATSNSGGMNARSQGEYVPHNRLLVIMTELLTTRILEAISVID